jgi:ABC-2 type transport system permease protein
MNGLNIPVTLRVARKDLKILLKDRGTLLYLFVIPIVFILAFSVGAGAVSDPKVEAISLPVVNLDAGSTASQTLLDSLDQGGGIQCELYDQAQAQALLEKEKINRVLTIPANYAADLQDGRQVTLRLVNSSTANISKTEAVYRVVTGVAADLSLETQLIASFRQMADMQAGLSSEEQIFTTDVIVQQAQSQFERARTEPILAVEESWPEALLEGDEKAFSPLSVYIPGFTVFFIFLTAQTTALSIYEERKTGSFRRLLAAPIGRATVLVGKMTPNFITGLVQIIVLFSAGVIIFPVFGLERMALGNDPLALILVCLIVLLCSTSLGVLIAAIARTEGQISGLSAVALWVFGFAGIWFNQMPTTSFLEPVSKVIPHYWANLAFLDLFVREKGLADILPGILVLLGFTVVFFAIGVWRFDFAKLNETGDGS